MHSITESDSKELFPFAPFYLHVTFINVKDISIKAIRKKVIKIKSDKDIEVSSISSIIFIYYY